MNFKFSLTCIVPGCGNKSEKDWYISPVEKKTKSGSLIRDFMQYKLTCKKCGKSYKVTLKIEA